MRFPKSYKLYLVLGAIALVSGHIVQDTRIWGADAVSRHDDTLYIAPGTVRLASADLRNFKASSRAQPEFQLPLPPVASLEPVAPLPRLPQLSRTRLNDIGLSNYAIPNNRINTYGGPVDVLSASTTDILLIESSAHMTFQ